MEQNKHPVIMTVCFILALALVLGGVTVSVYGFDEVKNTVVSWFSGDDADEDPPGDATKPGGEGAGDASGSGGTTVQDPEYFVDLEKGYGYKCYGDSTMFFQVAKCPNMHLNEQYKDNYSSDWMLIIHAEEWVGYGDFQPLSIISYSTNEGVTWAMMDIAQDENSNYYYYLDGLKKDDVVYISVFKLDNVSSPASVMDDLALNYFNEQGFTSQGEVIFANCPVTRNNILKGDNVIPVG